MRKRDPVYLKLAGYIIGYMKTEYVSVETMAEAANISTSTFYLRLHKPEEFRISELIGVSKKMGVSIVELIGG